MRLGLTCAALHHICSSVASGRRKAGCPAPSGAIARCPAAPCRSVRAQAVLRAPRGCPGHRSGSGRLRRRRTATAASPASTCPPPTAQSGRPSRPVRWSGRSGPAHRYPHARNDARGCLQLDLALRQAAAVRHPAASTRSMGWAMVSIPSATTPSLRKKRGQRPHDPAGHGVQPQRQRRRRRNQSRPTPHALHPQRHHRPADNADNQEPVQRDQIAIHDQ